MRGRCPEAVRWDRLPPRGVEQLAAQATAAHVLFESPELGLAALDEEAERPRRSVGRGCIVALHYCASTLYQIHFKDNRCSLF